MRRLILILLAFFSALVSSFTSVGAVSGSFLKRPVKRVEMRRPILVSLALSVLFSSVLVSSFGASFGAVFGSTLSEPVM